MTVSVPIELAPARWAQLLRNGKLALPVVPKVTLLFASFPKSAGIETEA